MEFHEKLQQLRKSRNLTQEELAEVLYVSRTAVSKWESGRGYPNIDSLKTISSYFSVSLDDLLSNDELMDLAQHENKAIRGKQVHLLIGVLDVLSLFLMILPLYPEEMDGYIYSVNLWNTSSLEIYNRILYWILFSLMMGIGLFKLLEFYFEWNDCRKKTTVLSFGFNLVAIFYFVMTKEVYVCLFVIVLLLVKSFLLFNATKGCLERK